MRPYHQESLTNARHTLGTGADYREQAAQQRKMAKTAPNETVAGELKELARQYERLAERLADPGSERR